MMLGLDAKIYIQKSQGTPDLTFNREQILKKIPFLKNYLLPGVYLVKIKIAFKRLTFDLFDVKIEIK